MEDLVLVLNPDKVVLEILEDVVPDEPMIKACRNLRAKGYQLALDDFAWRPEIAPLVELAGFIKIDVQEHADAARCELMRQLRSFPARAIAEKVETPEEQPARRMEANRRSACVCWK